ncbi:hypothetical protein BDK51DRAFT_30878, partial [Blyttiomyces helicus]
MAWLFFWARFELLPAILLFSLFLFGGYVDMRLLVSRAKKDLATGATGGQAAGTVYSSPHKSPRSPTSRFWKKSQTAASDHTARGSDPEPASTQAAAPASGLSGRKPQQRREGEGDGGEEKVGLAEEEEEEEVDEEVERRSLQKLRHPSGSVVFAELIQLPPSPTFARQQANHQNMIDDSDSDDFAPLPPQPARSRLKAAQKNSDPKPVAASSFAKNTVSEKRILNMPAVLKPAKQPSSTPKDHLEPQETSPVWKKKSQPAASDRTARGPDPEPGSTQSAAPASDLSGRKRGPPLAELKAGQERRKRRSLSPQGEFPPPPSISVVTAPAQSLEGQACGAPAGAAPGTFSSSLTVAEASESKEAAPKADSRPCGPHVAEISPSITSVPAPQIPHRRPSAPILSAPGRSSDSARCPICGIALGEILDAAETHVNRCLDAPLPPHPVAGPSRDAMPGRAPLPFSEPVSMAESSSSSGPAVDCGMGDLCFCSLCGKDITRYTTIRREQHMNRCLDETLEQQLVFQHSSKKPAAARPRPAVASDLPAPPDPQNSLASLPRCPCC